MSWNDHDHRGDYAESRHDHDGDYAEKYHRHHDDESTAQGLRQDLSAAEARIREVEEALVTAEGRTRELEQKHKDDIRRLWDAISRMPMGEGGAA